MFNDPMEFMQAEFPKLLNMILKQKEAEGKRTDIARLAAALLISGKADSELSAIDTACYMYEYLESKFS